MLPYIGRWLPFKKMCQHISLAKLLENKIQVTMGCCSNRQWGMYRRKQEIMRYSDWKPSKLFQTLCQFLFSQFMSIEPKDINVLCEHSNQYTTNNVFYYYLSSGYSNFICEAEFCNFH
jgi:hypothetical protein